MTRESGALALWHSGTLALWDAVTVGNTRLCDLLVAKSIRLYRGHMKHDLFYRLSNSTRIHCPTAPLLDESTLVASIEPQTLS